METHAGARVYRGSRILSALVENWAVANLERPRNPVAGSYEKSFLVVLSSLSMLAFYCVIASLSSPVIPPSRRVALQAASSDRFVIDLWRTLSVRIKSSTFAPLDPKNFTFAKYLSSRIVPFHGKGKYVRHIVFSNVKNRSAWNKLQESCKSRGLKM